MRVGEEIQEVLRGIAAVVRRPVDSLKLVDGGRGPVGGRIALILLLLAANLAKSQNPAPNLPASDANELVRRMVAREIEAANQPAYYRFRFRRETERGVFLGERILTKEGGISRTMSVNGKPLSEEQQRQWEQGARKLLADPALRERRRKELSEERERIVKLIRALPDAFLYEFDKREPDSGWARLKFHPNPNFRPPTSEAQAFRGMQGTMLVDERSERLARFDGKLVDDVDFGWGLLGKLYRGGQIVMENSSFADGRWGTSALQLQLKGRVLLIKSFAVDRKEHFSDFQPVPEDFTLAQAFESLLSLQLVACSEKRPANGFCTSE